MADFYDFFEARKLFADNPIPIEYITGALEHYRQDYERSQARHNEEGCWEACESGCAYAEERVEATGRLVGVFMPDPKCVGDIWAIEVEYNSQHNRFVYGVTQDGKYNLYMD